MPPPPQPSDFIVTVWLRCEDGIIRSRKVATDACDERTARDCAIRSLGLNFDGQLSSIVDIRIRRRDS